MDWEAGRETRGAEEAGGVLTEGLGKEERTGREFESIGINGGMGRDGEESRIISVGGEGMEGEGTEGVGAESTCLEPEGLESTILAVPELTLALLAVALGVPEADGLLSDFASFSLFF